MSSAASSCGRLPAKAWRKSCYTDLHAWRPASTLSREGRNRERAGSPRHCPRLCLGPTSSGLENSAFDIKLKLVIQAYSGYGNQARKHDPTGTDCGEDKAAALVQGSAAKRRLHPDGVRGACPQEVFRH